MTYIGEPREVLFVGGPNDMQIRVLEGCPDVLRVPAFQGDGIWHDVRDENVLSIQHVPYKLKIWREYDVYAGQITQEFTIYYAPGHE